MTLRKVLVQWHNDYWPDEYDRTRQFFLLLNGIVDPLYTRYQALQCHHLWSIPLVDSVNKTMSYMKTNHKLNATTPENVFFGHVRPAKIQLSLRIRTVWSESTPGVLWKVQAAKFLHADNDDWSVRGGAGWYEASLVHMSNGTFLTLQLK